MPIAVIVLLVSHSRLKERVSTLETQICARETPPEPEAAASPWPNTAPQERIEKLAPARPAPAKTIAAHTPPDPQVAKPSQAVVFNQQKFAALIAWIAQNSFYVVAAVSLALAGIFLVLYGIEQGLLSPELRLTFSGLFGTGLLAMAEYLRRRFGDQEGSATAYLPSTFASAGIVTLYSTVLSARLIYDFITAETTLIGLALTSLIALIFGWFYGPLLAAVGIIGALTAPFIIGGSSDDPSLLFVYFALITILGLGIDTVRRWAWVSVIALAGGFLSGTLLALGSSPDLYVLFLLYCTALVIAALTIPVQRLIPDHTGQMTSLALLSREKSAPWPEFPTRLAAGAILAATCLITVFANGNSISILSGDSLFWGAILCLAAILFMLVYCARTATALVDLMVLPAGGILTLLASTSPWVLTASPDQIGNNHVIIYIVALSAMLSAFAAWQSLRTKSASLFLALFAACFAPFTLVILDQFWQPIDLIGRYPWAVHVMVIAAGMVLMAERFAKTDWPNDKMRASIATLSALGCIALAVVILLSSAALTVALAVTLVSAAWLDRRYNMPLMGIYIFLGAATITYRLVIDPGLVWVGQAPFPEVLLSYAGAVIAFAYAYMLISPSDRPRTKVILESAAFSSVGILLSVLLFRAISYWAGSTHLISHWGMGIMASIWISLGLAQLHRYNAGAQFRILRMVLCTLYFTLGAFSLAIALTTLNPIFGISNFVIGPVIINSLLAAYLLPAVILGLGARWLKLRSNIPTYISIGLSLLWLALTIRHFWRGPIDMALDGFSQPELYTYTITLLLIGAGLFYTSLARKDAFLRKAGLIVIGLAVAKVFLIDISELSGLIRVFSFLLLGFSMAGLAWLNRWAASQTDQTPTPEPE